MNEKLISLDQVQTGYKQGRQTRVVSHAVQGELYAGTLTMLMGPNGSGKSTLLQTLSGMIPPLAGTVSIAGQDLCSLSDHDRATRLSLVLTDRVYALGLSVWELVSIGRYPYIGQRAKLSPDDEAIVHQALEACALTGFEQRAYVSLSDGEKQRVMIARALAQETPIMILDEPTAHLDLPSRIEVTRMLQTFAHQAGKCILVSTHELNLALKWADHIWLMDKSGQLTSGSPADLIRTGQFERCFGSEYIDLSEERKKLLQCPN